MLHAGKQGRGEEKQKFEDDGADGVDHVGEEVGRKSHLGKQHEQKRAGRHDEQPNERRPRGEEERLPNEQKHKQGDGYVEPGAVIEAVVHASESTEQRRDEADEEDESEKQRNRARNGCRRWGRVAFSGSDDAR